MGWVKDVADIVGDVIGIGGTTHGSNKQGGKHQFSDLMASAKNAGIHPLFALGASSNISPTLNVGAQIGERVAHGVGDIASSMDAEKNAKRRAAGESQRQAASKLIQDAQLRAMQAATSRDEAAASFSNSEAALNYQKLNGDGTGRGLSVVPDGWTAPWEGPAHAFGTGDTPTITRGGADSAVPAMIRVRAADGTIYLAPNPEAGGGSMVRPFLQELRELSSGQGSPKFKSSFGSGSGH